MKNRYGFSILPFAMAMVAFYVASHSPSTATLTIADTLLLMSSGLLFGIGVLALVGKLKI
jgi:hypothetical protein